MQVVVGVDVEQRVLLYIDSCNDGSRCARAHNILSCLVIWSVRAFGKGSQVRSAVYVQFLTKFLCDQTLTACTTPMFERLKHPVSF